jgi:hypothetical protein
VKEEEKNRSVEKKIQNGREETKKSKKRSGQKWIKINCLRFFPCLQVTVGAERKRGGGCYRPSVFAAARVPTSQLPRNLPATVPAVAEGLPCNSCRFWGVYFVLFKLYLIFEFLFFFTCKRWCMRKL